MSPSRVRLTALLVAGLFAVPAALPAQGMYPDPAANVAIAPVSEEELDFLLAPIALYPDQLLAQVLMAATFPLDVVEAARFVQQHPELRGSALDNAIAERNWDPSVLSLAAFPSVLQMMSERLDWTRRLGDVFAADQDRVMRTVQDLRARAQAAGTLVDSPEQRVLVEDRAILIEPARADLVYVPVYDPTIVYGPWWAPAYVPFYWRPPRAYYPGVLVSAGVVGFGLGYYISNHHWHWARPDWRSRQIAIDFHRHNRFIDRRPYYREWARDGWWRYDRGRGGPPGREVRGRDPRFAPGFARDGSGNSGRRDFRGEPRPGEGARTPRRGDQPIAGAAPADRRTFEGRRGPGTAAPAPQFAPPAAERPIPPGAKPRVLPAPPASDRAVGPAMRPERALAPPHGRPAAPSATPAAPPERTGPPRAERREGGRGGEGRGGEGRGGEGRGGEGRGGEGRGGEGRGGTKER